MTRLSLCFFLASLASLSLSGIATNASPLPRTHQHQHSNSSVANNTTDQTQSQSSNTYSTDSLRGDLEKIMNWSGDSNHMKQSQKEETIAAIIDSAARFYPDVDQQKISRAILADIRTESDFEPSNVSGAREDSGRSYGLMQVSPEQNGAQELDLFKQHYKTGNSYSGLPSLKDYKNGAEGSSQLEIQSLTKEDLFRPWVNIHVATWIQSNLGRTGSKDPSEWGNVKALGDGDDQRKRNEGDSASANPGSGGVESQQPSTTYEYGQFSTTYASPPIQSSSPIPRKKRDDGDTAVANPNPNGGSSQPSGGSATSEPGQANEGNTATGTLNGGSGESGLVYSSSPTRRRSSLPASLLTGFGSWVAGPNDGDDTGYKRSGDDISAQYFDEIMKGVQVLYDDKSLTKSWLSQITLKAGTVDYK